MLAAAAAAVTVSPDAPHSGSSEGYRGWVEGSGLQAGELRVRLLPAPFCRAALPGAPQPLLPPEPLEHGRPS